MPSDPVKSPTRTIPATIAGVLAATAALTFMVSAFPVLLPTLYADESRGVGQCHRHLPMAVKQHGPRSAVLAQAHLFLDLWLTVTLFAWWPNFLVAIFFTVVRFSIGWYISRCLAVVASFTLLLVLLAEMTMPYARLANSILLLRRERTGRLAGVEAATAAIAHEIRQPLAGIVSLGSVGLRWLNRKPAEVEKARSSFSSILGAAQRSDEIIISVRGLFKRASDHRAAVQLNDVIRLVMKLARHDVLTSGIRRLRSRCRSPRRYPRPSQPSAQQIAPSRRLFQDSR